MQGGVADAKYFEIGAVGANRRHLGFIGVPSKHDPLVFGAGWRPISCNLNPKGCGLFLHEIETQSP